MGRGGGLCQILGVPGYISISITLGGGVGRGGGGGLCHIFGVSGYNSISITLGGGVGRGDGHCHILGDSGYKYFWGEVYAMSLEFQVITLWEGGGGLGVYAIFLEFPTITWG